MRPILDPSEMTPAERRATVVAILASGLRRLRDRFALDVLPAQNRSENLASASETTLEDVPQNPLSDTTSVNG
ncbi:MAG: hypothetical protein LC104_04935 [Bacteroidales bacterium]|nr:hypothetical protein [Bacteroidales bacterium]